MYGIMPMKNRCGQEADRLSGRFRQREEEHMRTRRSIAAAAGLGLVLLAGCGSRSDGGNSLSDTEVSAQAVFDYDVNDYVTLGEYKNLPVQYPVPVVSDEDVEDKASELVDDNTEYKEVSGRAAQKGDYVNIDFAGTIDGEEFEGGSAEEYEFTLGEEEFLEEFEENIIGKDSGETFSFKMVFPEDYDDELTGKEAEFSVTINSVSEAIVPEYNDELVKKATEYDSVQAYEDAAREELLVTAQEEAEATAGEDALALAVANATINGYPQALYDACYDENMETYQSYAEMFGMEFDDFMAEFSDGGDIDSETLDWVNEILVSQAIALQEGFEITDGNYEEAAGELAAKNEYESLEDFEADYGRISIMSMLARERAIEFLYEHAKVEEVSEDEYYGGDDDEYLSEDNTEGLSGDTETYAD